MKKILMNIAVAFSMYSKIPMPQFDWTEDSMKYAMCFFPWVGAVAGLLEFLWFRLCMALEFGSLFRAAGIVLIPIIVTGGIHFDGFLDTSDAMSSWREREKRLEILKDSHVGAFAVITGISFFVLVLGAATEVTADMVLSLCTTFAIARSLSALSVVSFPKANPKGTAAAFGDKAVAGRVKVTMLVYLCLLEAAALAFSFPMGCTILVTAGLCFWYYHHLCMKYFGGMTGDLAGFFVSVCEAAILVAAVFVHALTGLLA